MSRDQLLTDPLVFHDSAPLGEPSTATFGFLWPCGATVSDLRADRSRAPALDRPLAQGDRAFAERNFNRARSEYRAQVDSAGDRLARRLEAMYKQSLAALALGLTAEAEELLRATIRVGSLATDEARDWVLPAAIRLWAFELARGQRDAADTLFRETIRPGRDADSLARQIPRSELAAIRDYYLLTGAKFRVFYDPQGLIRTLETTDQVFDLLRANPVERLCVWQLLLEGYWLVSQDRPAQELVDRMLAVLRTQSVDSIGEGVFLHGVARACWQFRSIGRHDTALALAHEFLARDDVRSVSSVSIQQALFLEVARTLVAAKKPTEALDAVRQFEQARPREQTPYSNVAYAELIRGFAWSDLRQEAEARAAWSRARYSAWARRPAEAIRDEFDRLPAEERVKSLMGESLAGTLTTTEIDRFRVRVLTEIDARMGTMATLVRTAEAQVQLRSEDYRTMAMNDPMRLAFRHLALQDLSFRETFLRPAQILFEETMVRQLPGPALTESERVLIRQFAREGLDSLHRQELKSHHFATLSSFWIVTPFNVRFGNPTNSMPPRLKPTLAYLCALRAERVLKDRNHARILFTEARDLSAVDSPLRQLAEAGLTRLGTSIGR